MEFGHFDLGHQGSSTGAQRAGENTLSSRQRNINTLSRIGSRSGCLGARSVTRLLRSFKMTTLRHPEMETGRPIWRDFTPTFVRIFVEDTLFCTLAASCRYS